MAKAKTEEVKAEEVKTEAVEEVKEAKPAKDAGEELVSVFIETVRNGDNSPVYVSVNGRNWLIQRGKEVMVPRMAAEVLKHSREVTAGLIALEEQASQEV